MDINSIDNGASGKGLLLVISSVSGGGKTTIIGRVMEELGGLRLSVSHTTRKPRSGESEGQDYHFTDKAAFKRMIEDGEFLEWANVYGHYYGTSRRTVDSIILDGIDAVLDIDVQGGMQVKEEDVEAILIFIVPPGEEEQKRRLRNRGTESETEVERRLEASRRELAFMKEYHYSVLNDDLDDAVSTVSSIIRAERCKNRQY